MTNNTSKAIQIAVISDGNTSLIVEALTKLGRGEIKVCGVSNPLPTVDVVICESDNAEVFFKVISHYKETSTKVICAFNFGIGGCATVIAHDVKKVVFAQPGQTESAVKTMLDCTAGYSRFWHISRNSWLLEAEQWLSKRGVSEAVGEYTMAAMVAHITAAILAGNETKTYPKFYLSTIVNDVY